MDFAERVAAEPASVTGADAESLRRHGLSDVDIFQVVLAACVRRFFSGVLTAVGAVPDAVGLDPGLLAALAIYGIENASQ
jgi:alkylhydroperoxidase family enzyme